MKFKRFLKKPDTIGLSNKPDPSKEYSMNQEISLTEMEKGHTGTVSTIFGRRHFRMKLESLGIRPGSKVTKVSNLFTRGPVVLYVGGTEVAIGYKMARKIMINIPTAENPS